MFRANGFHVCGALMELWMPFFQNFVLFSNWSEFWFFLFLKCDGFCEITRSREEGNISYKVWKSLPIRHALKL